MSDKFCGLYVAFDKGVSEEYIETIRPLISSIKGVISVESKISNPDHWFAREQAKLELLNKISSIFK